MLDNLKFSLQLIFILGCIYHCYTDWKKMLLYDEVNLVLLGAGGLFQIINENLLPAMFGGFLVGGIFFLLYLVCQGGMGLGDVKLAFVLGVWLGGIQGCISLLLSLWLGCIVGLMLIILKKRTIKDAIAFGPYMCVSGVIMLLWGEKIMLLYESFF